MHHLKARRNAWILITIAIAACSGREPTAQAPAPTDQPDSATQSPAIVSTTTASPPSSTTTSMASTTTSAPPVTTTTTATTTTKPPPTVVTSPGDYLDEELAIHLTFRSEVDDFTTADFEATAMAILTDGRGWGPSGFTFLVDDTSELTVVLAEPDRVDALCLPLETKGFASCQNGPVVALNAERWRTATSDWDTTIEEYRRYLVTHEVGHLIGLRHPQERCPEGMPLSAVMEPQTGGLVCPGNGWPLAWELTWAQRRPAVIAPLPEWDGPRPVWP